MRARRRKSYSQGSARVLTQFCSVCFAVTMIFRLYAIASKFAISRAVKCCERVRALDSTTLMGPAPAGYFSGRSIRISSIGSGKMIVEFCSAAISVSVWR